jgi:hypothetical protein
LGPGKACGRLGRFVLAHSMSDVPEANDDRSHLHYDGGEAGGLGSVSDTDPPTAIVGASVWVPGDVR